jgi:hypothetical protein
MATDSTSRKETGQIVSVPAEGEDDRYAVRLPLAGLCRCRPSGRLKTSGVSLRIGDFVDVISSASIVFRHPRHSPPSASTDQPSGSTRASLVASGALRERGSGDGPTPQKWIDAPCLRMDPTAHRDAALHVAAGPDMSDERGRR